MKTQYSILTVLALVVTFGFQPLAVDAQGSLTPPGPPGPTMLTLSQIEPRTPVDATHTPGNSAAEFVITNSGSYYLTTNIVGVSGEDGIDIEANNVTLDLNGFLLLGVSGSFSDGIQILSGYANVTVHNGTISGWGHHGVYSEAGNATFDRLNVSANEYGLFVYGPSVIRDCAANGNTFTSIGNIANDCFIFDNTCVSNGYGIVIQGNNNRVEDNHVTENGTEYEYGIYFDSPSTNNIIIRNSVAGSGTNDYTFSSPQITGPIITNAISGIITNSNPWANFGF
jgi:parallel beta-helix repeat protein